MTEVNINSAIEGTYTSMRQKHNIDYAILHITADNSMQIEKQVEGTKPTTKQQFEAFCEELPEEEPRYVVYDLRHKTQDGACINKLVFFLWCPEDSNENSKNLYLNHATQVKKQLPGLTKDFFITHIDDMDYETIYSEIHAS